MGWGSDAEDRQEGKQKPNGWQQPRGRALGPRSYHPAAVPHGTLLILNVFPELNIYLSVMVVAHCVSNSPTGRGGKEEGRCNLVPKDQDFWVGAAFQTTFISQVRIISAW